MLARGEGELELAIRPAMAKRSCNSSLAHNLKERVHLIVLAAYWRSAFAFRRRPFMGR